MLVNCQECGHRVSDKAAQCPSCAADSAVFLGDKRPCAECGSEFRSAYPTCASCGAPKAIARARSISGNDRATTTYRATQPAATEATRATSSAATKRFRRLSFTYGLMVMALIPLMLIRFFGIIVSLPMLMAAQNHDFETVRGLAVALAQFAPTANVTSWVSFAFAILMYSIFVYRGTKTIFKGGAPGLTTGPGMAVGSSFIPILNFFGPYFAMEQIWKGVHHLADKPRSVPLVMRLWWVAWLGFLIMNVVGSVLTPIGEGQDSAEGLSWIVAGGYFEIAGDICLILSCGMLIFFAGQIVSVHERTQVSA